MSERKAQGFEPIGAVDNATLQAAILELLTRMQRIEEDVADLRAASVQSDCERAILGARTELARLDRLDKQARRLDRELGAMIR